MDLTLGKIVHDSEGRAWVYIGYRVTTVGSHSHSFVRMLRGERGLATAPWVYDATHEETLRKKFSDL